MACAFEAFEDIGRANLPTREDRLLLGVLDALPIKLRGPIRNQKNKAENFDARLTDEARSIAIDRAETFRDSVRDLVERCIDQTQAVAQLRALLGQRRARPTVSRKRRRGCRGTSALEPDPSRPGAAGRPL